jgi:mannose-1-phosphate guanylyltransferase / phosphomannomutase
LEKRLFGTLGVQGICNVDLTPDFAGKLASAYGAALPFGAKIAISCDEESFSSLIKRAFAAGLHSAGVNTIECGEVNTPMLRYAVKTLEAQGGVHVRRFGAASDERLLIEFVDGKGLNIDKGLERKIENAFWQEDFRRAGRTQIGRHKHFPQVRESYVADLLRQIQVDPIKRERLCIAFQYDSEILGDVLPKLIDAVGGKAHLIENTESAKGELQSLVASGSYHLGVRLDENGERIALVTERGLLVEDELLLALQVLVHMKAGGERFAVPVTAPSIMERLAEAFQGEIVRTKANPRSLMEPTQGELFPMLFDGLYTLVRVLDTMAQQKWTVSQLLDAIPHFHIQRQEVHCAWEDKGRVMRLLMEDTKGETVELLDGIKVFSDEGWTLILPDSDGPLFQVYAQGATKQRAEELVGAFAEKIRGFQNETIKGGR